ncbi:MAG: universal stress protein [Planctomycetales bacterium]|nr:universal stress protein [Planctomycetales bacterium]
MFYFAYDGSINGDWVSHYAVQLAAAQVDRQLNLVHVRDGLTQRAELEEKLRRLRGECARAGVEVVPHILDTDRQVLPAVLARVPGGPEHFLLCGTRARQRQRAILSGTISEQLLRSGHCNVLALRVVQTGLLGLPRRLLLPVAGHPRGFRAGLPFLRLFVPQLSHLHILLVVRVSRWKAWRLSHEATERLRASGRLYCERVEREVGEQLGLGAKIVDAQSVVSDNVPNEIVLAANKTKSRLIYMGASERNLSELLLSGSPIEQVLRDATCDVAVYRGIE